MSKQLDEWNASLDRELDCDMKSALYMGPEFEAIAREYFAKHDPAYLADWEQRKRARESRQSGNGS